MLKGEKSFSQIIEELLEKSGHKKDPILEALETQNRLLSELLNEVRQLNRRLSGLSVTPVTNVKPPELQNHNLPSYLKDNPWLEILSERR